MKKILSLIIATTLVSGSTFGMTTSTAAEANNIQKISKTFDHFRYKMTVENDPLSVNQQKASTEFREELSNLQKQGIAPAEIMNYLRSSILDASTLKDFDLLMSSMPEKISSEDAGEMIMRFMSAKYQHGANYEGGEAALVAMVFIIAGALTFFLILNGNVNNNPHNCYYNSFGQYVCY